MYKSVSSTIIGGLSTLQYSQSLNTGITRTLVLESDSNVDVVDCRNESESLNIGIKGSIILESDSNVDGVEGQNESDLAITRLNQQIISSVVNSRDIEIDRLVKELEVFVCKVCKFRFVNSACNANACNIGT
jgi:hypothetical protein